MGTRNLTAVMCDNKYIVAQYGQWDGYPSGQGVTALEFLKKKFDKDLFLKKCELIHQPSENELKKDYVKCGADPNSEWIDLKTSDKFNALHPYLSRDNGAGILEMIQNATKPFWLKNKIEFAHESLFCEWCYVIDLDKDTFEVYEGFNQCPLNEGDRFYVKDQKTKNGYYSVRLRKTYSLKKLPSVKKFLEDFAHKEE